MSRGVPTGRSFLSFYRDKCALFHYFAFSINGCLLRKESLDTQSFGDLLTELPSHTLYGRWFDSLSRIEQHAFFFEYRIDPSSREATIGLIFGRKLPFHCIEVHGD
jgi:hypothetical protein